MTLSVRPPAVRFLAEPSPGAQMNASIMIHMQDMPAEKCATVKLHVVTVRRTRFTTATHC